MALFELCDAGWESDKKTDQLTNSLFGSPIMLPDVRVMKKTKKLLHTEENDQVKANGASSTGTLSHKAEPKKRKHVSEQNACDLGKKKKRKLTDHTPVGDEKMTAPKMKRERSKQEGTIHARKSEKQTDGSKNAFKSSKQKPVSCGKDVKSCEKSQKKGKHWSEVSAPIHHGTENKKKKSTYSKIEKSPDFGGQEHSPCSDYKSPQKSKKQKQKKPSSKKNKYRHLAGIPKWSAGAQISLPKTKTSSETETPSLEMETPSLETKTKAGKQMESCEEISAFKLDKELEKQCERTAKITKCKRQKANLKVKSPFIVEKLKKVLGKEAKTVRSHDNVECTEPSVREGIAESDRGHAVKATPKSLHQTMKDQLQAARFRHLNELLYTQSGEEALKLFAEDIEAFEVYHEGFQSQVAKWPVNPVDQMINYIKRRPKSLIVADFGCGDAKIARSVSHRVHSFDLVAMNEHVTVCNIAHVPLADESVDIGIFCLSLMGTNLVDFLLEANRVLKRGSILLIAEVVSRFEKVGSFIRKMRKLGFSLKKNDSNKMFILFEFEKVSKPVTAVPPQIELMPCLYKRR